jgi:hypothetical protein
LGIHIILRMNLVFHNYLANVNANLSPVITGRLKFNHTVNEGKKGIISAYPYITTWMNAGTPLTHQNSPGIYLLTGVSLYSQPFGLTVPTVMGAAASLFMCH